MRKILDILFGLIIIPFCVGQISAQSFNMVKVATFPEEFYRSILMFDTDHDGKRELIFEKFLRWDTLLIYENISGNLFERNVLLTNSLLPWDIGDADNDNLTDLVGQNNFVGGTINIYESLSPDTFPTELVWKADSHSFVGWTYTRITDLDRDGLKEVTFRDGPIFVYENIGDNSYEKVTSFGTEISLYYGFSFGDYDQDSLTEIVISGSSGDVLVYECVENDSFVHVWWDSVPAHNAYYPLSCNDMDSDGKSEFIIHGREFGLYYLGIFEAIGDNDYTPVWTYSVPGGGDLGGVATDDVDGDGIDELVFATGDKIRIFKAVGDNNYQLVWLHSRNVPPSYDREWPFVYDVNQNGYAEAIFWENDSTVIYEYQPEGIKEESSELRVKRPELYPAKPNPFTNSTVLSYELGTQAFSPVTLEIFDSSGRLVKSLVNKSQSSGFFRVSWDGLNNNNRKVPPGFYFAKLSAGNFVSVKKVILVR